jgi:hypothetical protein
MKATTIGSLVLGLAVGGAVGALLFRGEIKAGKVKYKRSRILVRLDGEGCKAWFQDPDHNKKGLGVKIKKDEAGVFWPIVNESCTSGSWVVEIKKNPNPDPGHHPLPDACESSVPVPSTAGEVDPVPGCFFPDQPKEDRVYEYVLQLCAAGTSKCQPADPELDVKRK